MSSTTTFKTNLNSISNGCTFAALKQHINTCIQRWRKKHLSSSKCNRQYNRNHQLQQEEKLRQKCNCYSEGQKSTKCFTTNSNKQRSFVERTTVYCKAFNSKLQKLVAVQQRVSKGNSTTRNDSKGPRKYGRKVEIVAKLLSATLIAKATTTDDLGQQTTQERTCNHFEEHLEIFQSSTTSSTTNEVMTITDLTFLEIRNEYPYLDSEIRSILTARAQDGATISEIRDDYRKVTGLTFPIYEDITEFLLTIPHVTAYCSEKGTRIFNIRPMEKTKHIHDMVMQQKQQQPEVMQRPSGNRYYYRERQRNSNYQPYTWRQNTSRRLQRNSSNIYVQPVKRDQDLEQEYLIPKTHSCYYEDNRNYLLNRICSQQSLPPSSQSTVNRMELAFRTALKPVPPPIISDNSGALRNFNGDVPLHNNNHFGSIFRPEQQRQNEVHQQNIGNQNKDLRRSSSNSFKIILPKSSRSSSPTAKSCYTSDSAYADSDYEAHILDFLLLGDDFFLYMARMELRCKFKKNQRILQSGLCVSGQTVGASIKRIKALSDNRRSIILNIGSVDIMQGRQLIQIEHEFRELLLTMLNKGIRPILTTLAPLANYSHNSDMKRLLERFNEFIKREGQRKNLVVIDIWKCLVNEKGHVFFDCFQNEPRNVTGTSESYLFWNKIGRQRVLQLIESKLEY